MIKKKEKPLCSCTLVHSETVQQVKKKVNDAQTITSMAEIFKVLSDPTRLKIVNALIHAELCVCDISALLNLTQPTISHHLKALRQTRVVKFRREGKMVYYSLDDEHIVQLFDICKTHISER